MSGITIPRDQFMRLIELAEGDVWTAYSEFSNDPTEEDRELMLAMWRLADKEVPPYFARTFGWKHAPGVRVTVKDS